MKPKTRKTIAYVGIGIGILWLFSSGTQGSETPQYLGAGGGGGTISIPSGTLPSSPAPTGFTSQPAQMVFEAPSFPEYSADGTPVSDSKKTTTPALYGGSKLTYSPEKDAIVDAFGKVYKVSTPTHRAVIDDATGKITYQEVFRFPSGFSTTGTSSTETKKTSTQPKGFGYYAGYSLGFLGRGLSTLGGFSPINFWR